MITIDETCGCGASFRLVVPDSLPDNAGRRAREWREGHQHAKAVTPGPCWHDSGVNWPCTTETIRCELDAGHAGAHITKRPGGGESVWPQDPVLLAPDGGGAR